MGWNDPLETQVHWVVTGKRGAAVRAGVEIESALETILETGTAVVSDGSPVALEGVKLQRIRLVAPVIGYVSTKVLRRCEAPPEGKAPAIKGPAVRAPAVKKAPAEKAPAVE